MANKIERMKEEYAERYKTRNLFIPNAGPPDYSDLAARMREHAREAQQKQDEPVREQEEELVGYQSTDNNQESQATHILDQDDGEFLDDEDFPDDIEIVGSDEMGRRDDEISDDLDEIILHEKKVDPLEYSTPYIKGDNVFLELLTYFKSNILGGEKVPFVLEEDHNCLLASVAAASRLSLIVEGKSRSGKSLIVDKMSPLLTSVYQLKVCSNKAVFGNAELINEKDFIYLAEFQSALEGNPAIKEALKLITEGKDATNDANGERQTLDGKITVLSTGADENVKTQKRDVEVSGRFILLTTVSNDEKGKIISDYQDGLSMGIVPDVNYSRNQFNRLKNHMHETLELDDQGIENPFARAFAEYLPLTQKSIYYRTLYHALVNGFTKFDRYNRVQKKNGKLITGIADIYLVYSLYHHTYCDALKKLSNHSFYAIEKSLNDAERMEKQEELQKELKTIKETREKQVNWGEVWRKGYAHMKERNSGLAEEWTNLQNREGEITIYDPIKKRDVVLCDHELTYAGE